VVQNKEIKKKRKMIQRVL
jgi:hypothetical protein